MYDGMYSIHKSNAIYCRSQTPNPIPKPKPKSRTLNRILYRLEKLELKLKPRTQISNEFIADCRTQISDPNI